ncbi:unnamed protein product [Prorocentrum cordatum]|uniref:PDZ domain-containing protein n=1 Tax=Prorocentrum cordatum TaxID=2364126 RepID=A0ABN9WDB1_9DINO|nr:unnamed protein product [Polarella glacialis]
MSSDALLGGQHLHPSQRERCGEVAFRASSVLRHWWKVTTSTEYRASLERRVVLKLIVAVVTEVFGIVSASDASWVHTLWSCVVVPFCLFAIPYESVWLDISIAAWNFAYYQMVSLPGELLWMILVIGWMRAGGIHSFALVPFLLLPLGERDLIERDYGCSGLDLQSFVAITILAVVWAFVVEWQHVDHFYRLQESTEVSQLLLGQATSGFCTLRRESGVVRDASSALMENLGMGIEGTTVYDFVAPDDCAKVASLLRHRDTLPPSPILCTLHSKPVMTGVPGAQFEAQLVPYAASEREIKVCLLKLGEHQEGPRAAPADREHAAAARAAEAPRAPEGGGALDALPQSAPGAPSEHGTVTSFAITASSQAAAVRSVAVQTSPPARPPRMPEVAKLSAPKRMGVQQGRRAHGRPRVRLNTSVRQVPGFEETPLLGRTARMMDLMEGINACGRGCCKFHVGVAAAGQVLDMFSREECGTMEFCSHQCPECLVLIDPKDGSTLQECETCKALMCPVPLMSGSTTILNNSDQVPPEAQERAPSKEASVFKVVLDRRDGAMLGIEVCVKNGAAVRVGGVKDGLVQQWNDSSTEAEVRPGDHIVAVNGMSDNPRQMLAEVGEHKILELTIRRGGPVE